MKGKRGIILDHIMDIDMAKELYLRAQFDRSFLLFQKLASRGNGEAMYFLGEFYSQGYGHVSQDIKKGKSWREKGADAGNLLAKLNTAYHLPSNSPRRQEMTASLFPDILAQSEKGDIFAQNELADMYLYGMGTKKNTGEALRWLECAGAAGFWRPLNKLGEVYQYGEGVSPDEEKARCYFARAAAIGYGDAEGNLAMCYYRAGDPAKAAALLRRAFAHGALYEGDIANMLGIIYIEGQGVKENERAGFAWLQRAADFGSVAGMNHLAICYEKGLGTAVNEEMAAEWSRKAADRGHTEAAVRYGIFLRERGKLGASLSYFKKSAEKGNADGETWYASCFLFGIGTKADPETAALWLNKAAGQGHEGAVKLLKEELGVDYIKKS